MRVTCGNIIRISRLMYLWLGLQKASSLSPEYQNICMDIMRNWDLDHAQNSPNASLERRDKCIFAVLLTKCILGQYMAWHIFFLHVQTYR